MANASRGNAHHFPSPQTQNLQSQKVRDCGSFSESSKEKGFLYFIVL